MWTICAENDSGNMSLLDEGCSNSKWHLCRWLLPLGTDFIGLYDGDDQINVLEESLVTIKW